MQAPAQSNPEAEAPRPAAIVLGLGVTGLATARALNAIGVKVHGVSFSKKDPGRVSRCCHVLVDQPGLDQDDRAFCSWLFGYARSLGDRPVVFPTSDETALAMAADRDDLKPVCRIWDNTLDGLEALVRKDRLYKLAASAGISVPESIVSLDLDEIRDWCDLHTGPYLAKPFYASHPDAGAVGKNRTFDTGDSMLSFLQGLSQKSSGLIVQRLIQGGDGWIYDCYGMCDQTGAVRTMATHRRVRQYLPDFGITSYGEVPGDPQSGGQDKLFELTKHLMDEFHYHGIFGVEWLQERETGKLYLIDINARPFYTIGHLRDCGLDLPMHAYRELCGNDLTDLQLQPRLKHKYWIDFVHDIGTFRRTREIGLLSWLGSVLRCRSFAVWSIRDPMPCLHEIWLLIGSILNRLRRRDS